MPLTYEELQALCARLTQQKVALEDRVQLLEGQHSQVLATTGALRDENRALHRRLLREVVRHERAGRKDAARELTSDLADIRAGTVPTCTPTPTGA